jgi:esterase/lipase superfamily enzyme
MAWPSAWVSGFCKRIGMAIVVCLVAVAAQADDLLIMERVQQELVKGATSAAFAILEDAIKSPGTSPQAQVDLLAELARLRIEHGDFADAGEALALEVQLRGRLDGVLAPELADLYAAAADAYAKAGESRKAVELAEGALRIDNAYFDCGSEVIARDHARIADLFAALGETARATAERALANDSVARCSRGGPSSRGIVVTNEFAATTPDSFARVKVFYATDRAPTGSARPNEYYGSDRGELEYGTVEVTVPRIHKPGEVESPSLIKLEWSENPERHFVISKIATMAGPEMFADMRATLAERKSDEVFVFVHGYNVSFAGAAKHTAQIAYDLNFQGAPILYSWPSAASSLAYIRDEAVVRLSGRHLLRFLNEVVAQSGAKHINLIAHSMGNRALADALELLGTRRSGAGLTGPIFDQAIFAAPDEDAQLFAEMLKTIRPLAKRLTLYGSDNDLALQASKALHGDLRRAGQGGDGILVADPVDSIDMSGIGADMFGHGYFAASTSALTDMSWLFWRNNPPEQRCGMDTKDQPGRRFWLFDPMRCDGPVMLSALTLLKTEGVAALAKLEKILAKVGGDKTAAEEWKAIRNAVLETPP